MKAKVIPINLSIPPEWLPERSKQYWNQFYKAADSVREVIPGDILALASLCVAWAENRNYREYLQAEGYANDAAELRPEYWLMSEAATRAMKGMHYFGLIAMARTEMFHE